MKRAHASGLIIGLSAFIFAGLVGYADPVPQPQPAAPAAPATPTPDAGASPATPAPETGPAPPTNPPAPVRITLKPATLKPELKFRVGEKRIYTISVIESSQGTMPGYQTMGLELTETATAVETVASVRPSDGAGTLVVRFRSVAFTANGQAYTSQSVVGPFRMETITTVLRPNGQMISRKVSGPKPELNVASLYVFNQNLLSSSADFPTVPVSVGRKWSDVTDSSKHAHGSETTQFLELQYAHSKLLGVFHTDYSGTLSGRANVVSQISTAYGSRYQGYNDQTFNLDGGYLSHGSGSRSLIGQINVGLTQEGSDNGYALRANSVSTQFSDSYTADLEQVIR